MTSKNHSGVIATSRLAPLRHMERTALPPGLQRSGALSSAWEMGPGHHRFAPAVPGCGPDSGLARIHTGALVRAGGRQPLPCRAQRGSGHPYAHGDTDFYVCDYKEQASFDDDIRNEVTLSHFHGFAAFEDRGHHYELYLASQQGLISAAYIDRHVTGGVGGRDFFRQVRPQGQNPLHRTP